MATINFSKIKSNTSTTDNATKVTSIKTSLVKSATPATSTSTDFTLSYSSKETYDLDEMIAEKRRDNSDSELILHTGLENTYIDDSDTSKGTYLDLLINIVAKRILDDYKITYSEDSTSDIYFKKMVCKVVGFEGIFNKYFAKYYSVYLAQMTSTTAGSISIDTIFHKFEVYDEDIKKLLFPEYGKPKINKPFPHIPKALVAHKASELSDATDLEKKYEMINFVLEEETYNTVENNKEAINYSGYTETENTDSSYTISVENETVYKLTNSAYCIESESFIEMDRVASFEED